MEYQVFPNILCLLHCVPLYVCRLCINLQDLCARLLGMAALRILLLTLSEIHCLDGGFGYGNFRWTNLDIKWSIDALPCKLTVLTIAVFL